jgi:acyl-CoA hydrolase
MTNSIEHPKQPSGLVGKYSSDSVTVMNELVLPNDTNVLNNLTVVTACVDHVSFKRAIRLGNLVTLTARVTRAFNTSMEIHLEVWAENIPARERFRCNEAYFTFVAVDHSGHPIQVPELIPQNEMEQKLYDEAFKRRQLRLV